MTYEYAKVTLNLDLTTAQLERKYRSLYVAFNDLVCAALKGTYDMKCGSSDFEARDMKRKSAL